MGKKKSTKSHASAKKAARKSRKRVPSPPPRGPEQWRAAGLAWLDAVPGGIQVATRLPARMPHHRTVAAAEDFGRRLVTTHLAGAAGFGAAPPGWEGDGFLDAQPLSLPSPQQVPSSWGDFYATHRLMPAARAALESESLDPASMGHLERLCELLRDGAFDDHRGASRIHGDLWRGTVAFTESGVVTSRPAAQGGHALTDLATLRLFKAPLLEAIEAGWAEVYRPDEEWRELIPLHQLHMVLAQSALFANPRTRVYYEGRPPHLAGEIAESLVSRAR